MKSEAARQLKYKMSIVSEDVWCAGWLVDLEHILWSVIHEENHYMRHYIDQKTRDELLELSKKCGGWIRWDGKKKTEVFVPMEKWLKIYRPKKGPK